MSKAIGWSIALFLTAAVQLLSVERLPAAEQPNFVVVMGDDVGWDAPDMGFLRCSAGTAICM